MDKAAVKDLVRQSYGAIAVAGGNTGCCGPSSSSSCCGPSAPTPSAEDMARRMGYTDDQLAVTPEGANLGLGCGNPAAVAAMTAGEVVVDLGSGAGFDAFLAARQVGATGRVIGVDMTSEMLAKARANAVTVGLANVEFRLGEIEHLPIADATADVVISNCVINLSPDKAAVFREVFRVLKPGGRIAVADVVATAPLPDVLARDPHLLCGCVSGAASEADIRAWMTDAGFADIRIDMKPESREVIKEWAPGSGVENHVVSATIAGRKP